MARQGQKLTEDLKEQIRALLVLGDNKNDISKKLEVSWATVQKIEKEIKGNPVENEKFEALRDRKKEQMIDKIWASLEDAADLGHSMIKEAQTGSRDIPLNQVSTYYGTLYDKMALMKGENTQNIGGLTVVFDKGMG